MKKALKWIGIALGSVVVLLAGAAIALRVFFPPDKVRALVVTKVEAALHRKLEVEDVSVGLFRGLSVGKVKLSERPDFSKGVFFEAESFSVRPSLLPLLHGELVVDEIRLSGALVRIKQGADGKFNYSDMVSTASSNASFGFLFSDARLEKSRVEYAAPGLTADADIAEARVRGVKPAGSFGWSVQVGATVKQAGRTTAASLKAKGDADLGAFKPDAMAFSVSEGEVLLPGGVKAAFSVQAKGLDPAAGSFKLSLPALTSAQLAKLAPVPAGLELPPSSFEAKLKRAGLKLTLEDMKLSFAGLVVEGGASWDGAKAAFNLSSNTFPVAPLAAVHPAGRGLPLKGLNASFKTAGSWADQRLSLASLDASAGPVKLTASGAVNMAPGARSTLKLATNLFSLKDLAALSPDLSAYKPAGQAKLEATVEGAMTAPSVRGLLSLSSVGGSYKGVTVSELTTTANVTESSVHAPSIAGKLSGSPFTLSFDASAGQKIEVKLNGKIERLDAGALAGLAAASAPTAAAAAASTAPAANVPPLRTSGSFAIGEITHPNLRAGASEVRWDLDGVTPKLDSINGTANFRVGKGQTTNLLQLAQAKAGKALLAPLVAIDKARGSIPGVSLPDVNNLPFDRIMGDYSFKNGVMRMAPSLFEGPTLTARSEGTVDLVKDALDLKVNLKVAGMQPALNVTGTMAAPKTSVDLSALKNKAKEELQDQLQKQGENLLKGLFR